MPTKPQEQTPTVAVIDIGTNSVKLLIAQVKPSTGAVVEKKFQRETTRIGEGVSSTGEINAAALLRTVNAVARFHRLVKQYDCDGAFAFSTHAFREARNGREAAERITDETSVPVRILSGDDEARLAYMSARTRLGPLKPHTYIIDVGGGSTEFVHAARGRVATIRSLPLGALLLTERFLKSDPVDTREIAELRTHVRTTIGQVLDEDRPVPASQTVLVASGGSITTIKKMSDRSWVHSSVTTPKIRIGDVRRLEKQCLSLPLEKRKRLPGIEPDRADIIPAGLAVALAFMEATGKRVVKINPGGVRVGVLIHLVRNNFQW
jgi:exopolyphosphatase/guanosine-5'-triphosphate,3'-diphosphate pyrophosphatase